MGKQLKRQDSPLTESSETESEHEVVLSTTEYTDSIKWKIGTSKADSKDAVAKPKKSAGEVLKRVIVGFMVLAWYVCPMYVHPLCVQAVTCHMALIVHGEAFSMAQKTIDAPQSRLFRYTFSAFLYYVLMPRFGMFERSIVEESGFHAQDYPWTFTVLYERNSQISLVLFSLLFLFVVCSWRKRNLRFQLWRSTGLFLLLVYVTWFSCAQGYAYIKGGRWWAYFSVLSVALNDACAFFAGKLFGWHNLIGLSPNKSLEGFLGGAVSNVIQTGFMASCILVGDFWQCAPGHFNFKPFEDWTCHEIDPMYHKVDWHLPGGFSVSLAPAVVYTVAIAMYVSLVSPFLGFFASGFKRAIGIKDFATTLPGHGGLMDRMDCISITCFFNYFFLTQVILKDRLAAQGAFTQVSQLDDSERQHVLNDIATRFGLTQF